MNSLTQNNIEIETKIKKNYEMKSIRENYFRRNYKGDLATKNTKECAIVLKTC